ncbi:imidazole glycerol phosphate synthase subunit HisH [Candidatus Bathyarchaeota archaeon]|jgi:imidazole glycerol phosphate synthase glutamine amidotransferase subunit|nr:imidazole glycerol phosphate synthase subunit HisH [Candidatus Bathyarchaeota archaeon]MDP6048606.1 imidazole glycerol phosphate synthase subunit HisH [Candidatus Bathyarchaeota archaeon]MDP7442804.1 imidazole glycerol phosphate synthase subunit HisH [Candidatus Bathyarchaeota archaeon]|tara:strand:- start:3288 stop:3902 length:615 start_codon:yes stop_codon:yes gene_type:complete
MAKVAVLDYGVGNLFSMSNALERAGLKVKVTREPEEIASANAIVLPGVGNFGPASIKLKFFAGALQRALEENIPILGSCLGMQLLFEGSEESPKKGLGLLKGWVRRFQGALKVPHMGWNTIKAAKKSPLLEGIPDGQYFYFVHSYYPEPAEGDVTLAVTEYNGNFTSMVECGPLYGCQFHPEKSGKAGAVLLSNFADIVKRRRR